MNLQESIQRIKKIMEMNVEVQQTNEQFEPLIQKGKEIINKFIKEPTGPKKDSVILLNRKKKRFNEDWSELVRKMRSKEITTTEFLNGIRILKKQYGINDITDFDEKTSSLREVDELDIQDEDLEVKIYSNGGGSDNAAEYEGEIVSIPVKDTIPNEPFKDLSYMENSKIIKLMIKSINSGDELPPIKVIEHPYDPSKYLVVDGNHRRFAFSKSDKENIDAIVIPHEDILLMKNEWGEEPEESIRLIDVIDDKEIIDQYFVKPDSTNSFDKNSEQNIEEEKKSKESGEKWLKCDNCNKKYTQTIHKGKKSLPICPHCGTHNSTLKESIIPISIKRRATEEGLKKYISLGELNYPTLCDDFDDEYEYADSVIDYALDEFLDEIDNDILDEDYYSDVMDYLRNLCRNLFGEYLLDVYKTTCEEYNSKENVIKENDDLQTQWDTLIDFENILNRKMPKKFPWWKEIDLESIGYNTMGQIIVYGNLFVDEDWAKKQWNILHPSQLYFPRNNIEFNELLTVNEWLKLVQYVGKLYHILTGQNPDRISLNRVSIYFDVPQLPKMEQNESEITERCWKGYTQKGMKTMFGKRYPNCVKKKS